MARWMWASVFALGCLDPTEVVVTITTDVPCAKLGGTSIRVGTDPGTPPSAFQPTCDADGTIGTIVVLPDSALAPAVIQVTTGVGKTPDACDTDGYRGGCIVARRSVSFISHDSLALPIEMQQSCLDVACDPTSTCVNGACQPIARIDFDASAPDASAADTSVPDDGAADAGPLTVEFVAAGGKDFSATGGIIVVPPPAPTAVGEAVVLVVEGPLNMTAQPVDTGWIAVQPNAIAETAFIWVRLVASSEPADYSVQTGGATGAVHALVAIYKNVGAISTLSLNVQQGAGAGPGLYLNPVLVARSGSRELGMFGSLFAAGWNAGMLATSREDRGTLFLEDTLIVTGPSQSAPLSAMYQNGSSGSGWAEEVTLQVPP